MARIDPDENANRWYAVGVQPSLLDPIAVVCFWGSRETAFQEMQIKPFDDQDAAREAADKMIRAKVRQKDGYIIVGGYVPANLDARPMPDDE
jgi:predicted DNA-binding WGR domain protein